MPLMPNFLRSRFAQMCLLIWSLPIGALAADRENVWQLLDAGKAQEALDVAFDDLPADDPERDLLIGVAAAEAGNGELGVRHLSRHLQNHPSHPQNPRAHLELGRSYLQVGELDAAQKEYQTVLESNPPAEVAENIRRGLASIESQRRALRTPRMSGYAEFGFGHDSNINAGVKDLNVNLPVFGEIQLNDTAREQAAFVSTLTGGIDAVHALRADLSLFGSARLDSRFHLDHSDLDQLGLSLSAGAARVLGRQLLRASAAWNAMRLDWQTYRNVTTATGEWLRELSPADSVGLFAQFGTIRYSGFNSPRNANLFGGGAAYTHAFGGELKPLLRLALSHTVEDNRRQRDDLGRSVTTARADLEFTPATDWNLSAGVTLQRAAHRGEDTLMLTRRKDDYAALDLGVNRRLRGDWNLRGELQIARNDSNLALYEYDRTLLMFKVRRDFR